MAEPLMLDDNVWVSGQVAPQTLADLAARLGVQRIVNNRPDHEEPGQPTSDEVQAAADAAGLDYVAAPIRGMPEAPAIRSVADALADGTPTLLFCRSGMRSTAAWAMAKSAGGTDPDELRARAGAAGYDLSRLPL